MRKKVSFLILGVVLLAPFILGGSIGLMTWWSAPEHVIARSLGLSSFEAPLVKAYESSGRDRCVLRVYECKDDATLEAFKSTKDVKAFPLPKALYDDLYGLKDTIGLLPKVSETEEKTFIPQMSEGYYSFKDRTPNNVVNVILNYTLISYDTNTDYLYYLEFSR